MPNEPGDSWFSPKHVSAWSRIKHGRGRALNWLGEATSQFKSNSEYYHVFHGNQSLGAKLQRQKGNNPDLRIRSLNVC